MERRAAGENCNLHRQAPRAYYKYYTGQDLGQCQKLRFILKRRTARLWKMYPELSKVISKCGLIDENPSAEKRGGFSYTDQPYHTHIVSEM